MHNNFIQGGELELITVEDALTLLGLELLDKKRSIKRHEILEACGNNEIAYIGVKKGLHPRKQFVSDNGDKFRIVKTSLLEWSKQNSKAISLTPSWEYFAKLPFLTENECACLIEGVEPSLYCIVEVDYMGNEVSRKHDLPSDILKCVELTHKVIERSTHLDLKPISAYREWHEDLLQYRYKIDDFAIWADHKGYKLNETFINHLKKYNQDFNSWWNFEYNALANMNLSVDNLPYLDKKHPCYSPRLVAAIKAWEHAVSQHDKNQQTPKQNIEKWLDNNVDDLGFDLSKQLKESISRIANYRDKTSSVSVEEQQQYAKEIEVYAKLNQQKTIQPKKTQNKIDPKSIELDPEIPF